MFAIRATSLIALVALIASNPVRGQLRVSTSPSLPSSTLNLNYVTTDAGQADRVADIGLPAWMTGDFGFNSWSTFHADGKTVTANWNGYRMQSARVQAVTSADLKVFGATFNTGDSMSSAVANRGSFSVDPLYPRVTSANPNSRYAHTINFAGCLTLEYPWGPSFPPVLRERIVAFQDNVYSSGSENPFNPMFAFYTCRAKLAQKDINIWGPVSVTLRLYGESYLFKNHVANLSSNNGRVTMSGAAHMSLGLDGEAGISILLASAGVGGDFDIGATSQNDYICAADTMTGSMSFYRSELDLDIYVWAEAFGSRGEKTILENVFALGVKTGTINY